MVEVVLLLASSGCGLGLDTAPPDPQTPPADAAAHYDARTARDGGRPRERVHRHGRRHDGRRCLRRQRDRGRCLRRQRDRGRRLRRQRPRRIRRVGGERIGGGRTGGRCVASRCERPRRLDVFRHALPARSRPSADAAPERSASSTPSVRATAASPPAPRGSAIWCTTDPECGPGLNCVAFASGPGTCLWMCRDDGDCPSGATCLALTAPDGTPRPVRRLLAVVTPLTNTGCPALLACVPSFRAIVPSPMSRAARGRSSRGRRWLLDPPPEPQVGWSVAPRGSRYRCRIVARFPVARILLCRAPPEGPHRWEGRRSRSWRCSWGVRRPGCRQQTIRPTPSVRRSTRSSTGPPARCRAVTAVRARRTHPPSNPCRVLARSWGMRTTPSGRRSSWAWRVKRSSVPASASAATTSSGTSTITSSPSPGTTAWASASPGSAYRSKATWATRPVCRTGRTTGMATSSRPTPTSACPSCATSCP